MYNFLEASKRHYRDAEFLQSDVRLPNAAQLFGFAAECGVKALIEKVLNKPLPPEYEKHANALVNLLRNLQVLVNGRQNAKYLAGIKRFKAFGSWLVEHRYQSEANIPLKHMQAWADAAKEIQIILEHARIDGVL
jgi:hypothetical protein